MSINLRQMNYEDFSHWSSFSFRNFVGELAKSSGKSFEEVKTEVGLGPSKMSQDDLWYVIESDKTDIGFFWIKFDSEQKSAFGYDIWLHEHMRSKGIGREVMLAGKIILKSKGIERLQVCVFEENTVARGLYESLGFHQKSYDLSRKQYHLEILIS